jgi:uncharacterized membrane protein YhaH (DUF805 family)
VRSYFDGLLRYFEFSGRSSRVQYWLFQLVFVVLLTASFYGDYRLNGRLPDRHDLGLLSTFVVFFHFVPQITVTVRRLHDIGKSGWWYLLLFVPLAGLLVFVWTFYASEDGSNDYGDDPRNTPSRPTPVPTSYRGVRTSNAQPRPAMRLEGQSVSTQRFI